MSELIKFIPCIFFIILGIKKFFSSSEDNNITFAVFNNFEGYIFIGLGLLLGLVALL